MATLAELYSLARTTSITKPCSWIWGQSDITADDMDMAYLARAHYSPDGKTVTLSDGSRAEKLLSRNTPWKVVVN